MDMKDCRSRITPRERRFEFLNLLFLRIATSRFLPFCEGVKIAHLFKIFDYR